MPLSHVSCFLLGPPSCLARPQLCLGTLRGTVYLLLLLAFLVQEAALYGFMVTFWSCCPIITRNKLFVSPVKISVFNEKNTVKFSNSLNYFGKV